MEAKLKQLKVADLKDILTRAQVSIPGRANKPELMALIQGSQEALAVYDELHGGGSVRPSGANTPRPPVEDIQTKAAPAEPIKTSDILAPPEPFDWTTGIEPSGETTKKTGTTSTKTAPAKPPTAKVTVPAISTSAAAALTANTQNASKTKKEEPAADEDEEEKKRRARAERFGVSVVSTAAPSQKKEPAKATADKSAAKSNGTGAGVKTKTEKIDTSVEEDPEKLKARAMRFGLVEKTKHVKPSPEAAAVVTGQKLAASTKPAAPANTGQKRAAPAEKDDEEAERRRKRAERFGLPVKT